MARPAKAPAVNPDGTPKAKRVVGPRPAYIIFKQGTDPAFVAEVANSVDTVTLNGRALLKAITGGNMRPFLEYTVHVEARGDKDEAAAS